MNLHALVVENDSGTRKLLDVLLSRAGYDVDAVAHGEDGITLLQHVDYDFIVLDLMLGATGGGEVLAWITAHRPDVITRVLLLSAASGAQLEHVQRRFPDVRVMRKPFDVIDVSGVARIASEGRVPQPRTTAEEFCRRSIIAGAKAGLVVRRRGDALVPVEHFGYPPGALEQWFPMPLDAAYPMCSAVRLARPVWLASLNLAAAEYPLLAPVWKANRSHALAVVPLARDGDVIGAAGWSFREPHRFPEREQRMLVEVAEVAATLIAEASYQSGTAARP